MNELIEFYDYVENRDKPGYWRGKDYELVVTAIREWHDSATSFNYSQLFSIKLDEEDIEYFKRKHLSKYEKTVKKEVDRDIEEIEEKLSKLKKLKEEI